MNDVDYDIQEKLMNIMKERQIQLTELKTYFDKQNTKHYKDIIKLNLNKFEDIISKSELNKKCESLLSIAISISKILELNHSVKSILLSLKIMEEHKKHVTSTINKSFVYKIFEDSSLIALNKNPWLKKRNFSYAMTDFYKALFEESDNFFNDFNNYLNFQTDKKQKPSDSKIKANVFADQVTKILAGSTVNNYILYKPCYINIDLDYSEVVKKTSDVLFILYNKFADKTCFQPDLVDYINQLDDMIYEIIIKPASDDLYKLADHCTKKEFENLNKELDKHFI